MLFTLFETLKNVIFLLGYMSNSTNSFPKPLSREDEEKYLHLFKDCGCASARNTLIEHNLRLVAHIVKKYSATSIDSDDLISIGTIGLMKGIESFKPEKGSKLSTYVSRCIEKTIVTYWQQTHICALSDV